MDQRAFNEILKEQLEVKGFTLSKLANATGIPDRFLEGLLSGDFEKLPPAPYVRGYINRIAALIGIDGQELWELYKQEQTLKKSGAADKLPTNRFAIKAANKKLSALVLAAVILGIYFSLNIGNLLGQPNLDIINPVAQTIIVAEPIIKLSGKLSSSDKLLINGEEVVIDESGIFEEDYNLQSGLNTIEFVAKRFLGKETTITKQVIYQPQLENYGR